MSSLRPRLVAGLLALAAVAACRPLPTPAAAPAPRATAAGVFVDLAPDVFESCGMTASRGAIWVLACSAAVVRVPAGGGATATRKLDGDIVSLSGIAGDGADTVWALLARGSGAARKGAVVRLAAASGEQEGTILLAASLPMHAVFLRGALWVAAIDGRLYAVDGAEARSMDKGSPLVWIASDRGRMWTVGDTGDVVERDPSSGRTARTWRTGRSDPLGAAAGLGSVWVSTAGRGVARIDAATGAIASVDVVGTVNAIEPCGSSVWLSQPDFGVRSLDAKGTVTRSVKLSVAPRYLECAGDKLWVLSEDGRLGWIDAST